MGGLGATESAAVLLCGGLLGVLLVRLGIGSASALAARAVRAGRRWTTVATPRLARRCLAALAGLAAPLLTQVSAASAAVTSDNTVQAVTHRTPTIERWPAPSLVTLAARVYVVEPGDTLWDIARRHLPRTASDADVARAWPHWFSMNRAAIGSDPDHLVPGMRLRIPGSRATGTSPAPHPPSAALRAATSLDPDRR
jgi:Tfp pilus assembly protein FimV